MENKIVEAFKTMLHKPMEMYSPSPLAKWLNGTYLEAEEGYLKASFVVRKEMTNPQGVLHGGIVCAIMDELMGAATYTLNKEDAYTSININTDFLYSAKENETIIATANVFRAGKKIVHFTAEIKNEDGKIIAKASSNLVAVSRPKFV